MPAVLALGLLGGLARGAGGASGPAAAAANCASRLEHRGDDGWVVRVTHGLGEPCAAGTIVVRLQGPQGQQEAFTHPRDGVVETLWLEDLDRDGVVEIAVQTRTGGSGGRAEVAVFARGPQGWVSRRIAPLAGAIAEGYQGRDTFEFVDGAIVRRFPVFKATDAPCCPTGGRRTLGLSYAEGRWVPFTPRAVAPSQKPGAPGAS